jgi:hypothetical protein
VANLFVRYTAHHLPEKRAEIVVLVNSDISVGNANPAPTIVKALTAVVTPNKVPE